MNHIFDNSLYKKLFILTLSLLIAGLLVSSPRAELSRKAVVAVLPFNVQYAGDFSYLQDGASNMLGSRVTVRADVQVAAKSEPIDMLSQSWITGKSNLFEQYLKVLPLQYVIAGSLVSHGEGLRLDVYFFDKDTGKRSVFTADSVDGNGILSAIDSLSWDIAEKFFGKKRPIITEKKDVEGIKSGLRFQTPHPDREFKNAVIFKSDDKLVGLQSAGFSTVASANTTLDMEIKGMSIGDIDNDGKDEIVVVSNTQLAVMNGKNSLLQVVDSLEIPGNLNVYALYFADLNKNGFLEMYISASSGDTPSSLVLEWKGKGQFSFLLAKIPYYLRPLKQLDGIDILAGQRDSAGQEEFSRSLLGSPVYHLVASESDGLQELSVLDLPDPANIFNFVTVDLDNDGVAETVLIDDENRLQVFGSDGVLRWSSGREYGFSKKYLGVPHVDKDDTLERKTVYVMSKLLVDDINDDGFPDIIVGKNRLSSPIYLKNIRYFDGATIAALTWTGEEMSELWQTGNINNYLADFDFHKAELDRKDEKNDSANLLGKSNGKIVSGGYLYAVEHLKGSSFDFLLANENQSKIQVFKINSINNELEKVQIIKPE